MAGEPNFLRRDGEYHRRQAAVQQCDEQARKHLERLEAEWEATHPGEGMGPVVSARLAAKAWAYERPAKKLREDVTGTDLILLQVALAAIASTTQDSPRVADRDDIGQLYRRYLWVLLDGLRPHRDATSPLPVPPLTTQQAHILLGSTPEE